MAASALPRGATIGILGGGQLGRMLCFAAARLGFETHVFSAPGDNPAFHVCSRHTQAEFEDTAALERFARQVDVVTYEWENVPVPAIELLAAIVPVRPDAEVLRITQDRLSEKAYISGLDIAVPAFHRIDSPDDLERALTDLNDRCVLKTRRFGYDGRGQARIAPGIDTGRAWADIGEMPAIVEEFVPFSKEISVIAARGLDGSVKSFDIAENVHENGILRSSTVPASITGQTAAAARRIADKLLQAMDYCGVMGVEMFVLTGPDGETLMVNEVAPRVHNSGHWTEAACDISQFEQHIRAIAGWPVAEPQRHSDCCMQNLLGDEILQAPKLANSPATLVHDYGKSEIRAGRKMGHFTRLSRKN